jgi:hypothetical protein
MSKPVFVISEEDVWAMAEHKKIKVPEERKEHVLYYVKKYLEGYCYGGAYNIWDAIADAIKDALQET